MTNTAVMKIAVIYAMNAIHTYTSHENICTPDADYLLGKRLVRF